MITRRKFFGMIAGTVAALAGLPKLVEAAKEPPMRLRWIDDDGNPVVFYNQIPIKYVNCLTHGNDPCDCPRDDRPWYWYTPPRAVTLWAVPGGRSGS